jgi:hypothetical protein
VLGKFKHKQHLDKYVQIHTCYLLSVHCIEGVSDGQVGILEYGMRMYHALYKIVITDCNKREVIFLLQPCPFENPLYELVGCDNFKGFQSFQPILVEM